jgi:DMSO reductase anchor subunit
VETAVVRAAPAATFDLPDAPDPTRVMPTTRYVSKRGLQKGLSAADAAQVKPEHAHLPLVLMLVISQAVTGYWVLLTSAPLLGALSQDAPPNASSSFPWAELAGVVGVQLFLALSLLHLGRPWLAWKAVLGWRRSWLSREVIAFSALAGSTGLYSVIALAQWWGRFPLPSILAFGAGIGVLLCAAAALHASAMVYRDTPRALWATRATLWRFVFTAALCGIPAFMLAAGTSRLMVACTGLRTPWARRTSTSRVR